MVPVRRVVMLVMSALLVVVLGSAIWVRVVSAGHLHEPADAPRAPVVIVFGGKLAPDRVTPWTVLRNRLDTTDALVKAGKAEAVLVSGDAHGTSGDETAAM